MFRAISTLGCCISRLVILEKISLGHLQSALGFSSDWSHVPRMVPTTLTKSGKTQLELCCLNLGILTSLALSWNGIVQMESSDNIIPCLLPGLGIIQNKSWLLKSHMAHGRFVQLRKVCQWGIQLFDRSITQETSIFTQSCWRTIIFPLCTLQVSV